jgi:hypothetical protein
MDKEQIYSVMEISIQVNIRRENRMEKGNILGAMDKHMLASLKMDINMGKESGEVAEDPNVINTKENT